MICTSSGLPFSILPILPYKKADIFCSSQIPFPFYLSTTGKQVQLTRLTGAPTGHGWSCGRNGHLPAERSHLTTSEHFLHWGQGILPLERRTYRLLGWHSALRHGWNGLRLEDREGESQKKNIMTIYSLKHWKTPKRALKEASNNQ